jgi:hypothetical protein
MLSLKIGQQAALEGGHIFERDSVEIPLGGRQQSHHLRSQREWLIGGLPEHSPQPLPTPDLALGGLVHLDAEASEAGYLLELRQFQPESACHVTHRRRLRRPNQA